MSPNEDYQQRHLILTRRSIELERRSARFSWVRILTFATIVVAAVGGLAWGWSWWSLAIPGAAFLALVVAHDRVLRELRRCRRAIALYDRGLARLEDRWMGTGEEGQRFRDPGHPYADDLDLFGPGSLYQLLCTARSRPGQDRLADWLLSPASAAEVRARQLALGELRDRVDLREEVGLLGPDRLFGLDPQRLAGWAQHEGPPPPRWERVAIFLLATVTVAAIPGWLAWGWGPWPLIALIWAQWLVGLRYRKLVSWVHETLEASSAQLDLLSSLLSVVERERFEAPRLRQTQERLGELPPAPSSSLRALRRWGEWLDSARNMFFAPVAAITMWKVQVSLAIDAWRARFGSKLPSWLLAAGEFEALLALSGYTFEHPDQPFPEILDDGHVFDAQALGHPLIPRDTCVRNDLSLDEQLRLYVISGSNMSGKSTMLRTVGINAVLALAGAPVRAEALRLAPVQVAASIRVVDSLQEGVSHFYAELQRLRQMVTLTLSEDGQTPLLLLDEIFHGTNSHDRRLGADALVHRLLDGGALVLLTTHDLAVAEVADQLGDTARNVHFEDQMLEGRMEFDYRMRPGVVTRGNALELMRTMGLIEIKPPA